MNTLFMNSMKTINRTKLATLLAVAAVAVTTMAATAAPVSAATYTVNTIANEEGDGQDCKTGKTCSLHEAIKAANTDATADTIVLPAGEYTIDTWLPLVVNPVTIQGAGANTTTVNSTMGTAADNQVFYVTFEGAVADTVSLENFTISGGSGDRGGAIYNKGTHTLELKGMEIVGNSASQAGGGLFNDGSGVDDGSQINIYNSTFTENSAPSGGALFIDEGTAANVINSTIVGNTATTGAGIYSGIIDANLVDWSPTLLSVVNSTIAGNAATTGGGVYTTNKVNRGGDAVHLTSFSNSIVSNNTATTDANVWGPLYASDYTVSNDMTGVGMTTAENTGNKFSADAKLATDRDGNIALALNGGTTRSVALNSGSAAMNMIPTATCNEYTQTGMADQRNMARPQGTACDAGSYEVEQATTGSDNGTGDDGNGGSSNDGSEDSSDNGIGEPGGDTIGGIAGSTITDVTPEHGGINVHYDNGTKLYYRFIEGNAKPQIKTLPKKQLVVAVFRGKQVHFADYTNGKVLVVKEIAPKASKRKNTAITIQKVGKGKQVIITSSRKHSSRVSVIQLKAKKRTLGQQTGYRINNVKARVNKTHVWQNRIVVQAKTGKVYTYKLTQKYRLKSI